MLSSKFIFNLAAINGFIVVALGAFGAHALREKVTDTLLHTWETAVHYHAIHTLVLLALAILAMSQPSLSDSVSRSALIFQGGILLFCGSLYALVLSGTKILGIITPIGGLILLAAWASLLFIRSV